MNERNPVDILLFIVQILVAYRLLEYKSTCKDNVTLKIIKLNSIFIHPLSDTEETGLPSVFLSFTDKI